MSGEQPPETVATVVEPPPLRPPIHCSNCGAQIEGDQGWCTECGLAARTRIAKTPNWRLPLILAGALALGAIVALIVAFVVLTGDNAPLPQTVTTSTAAAPVDTVPTTSVPVATTTVTTTPLTTTPAVPTTTTPPEGTSTIPGATVPTPAPTATTPGTQGGAAAPTGTPPTGTLPTATTGTVLTATTPSD